MSVTNLQTAIQNGKYTAEAVFFENTKKDWRGENAGRGVCEQICITPYHGEDHIFTPSHPDFVGMFRVATQCSHGLHWSEEAITEENLADFSRTVLAHGYIENPMARIQKAIELVSERDTIRTQMRAVQRAAAKRSIEQ